MGVKSIMISWHADVKFHQDCQAQTTRNSLLLY